MKNIEIDFKDLFRPNRFNVNPDNLKVNDVIETNGLGLMELIAKIDSSEESPLHGRELFTMRKLFGDTDNTWTLYSSSFTSNLEYVKMATDEDIVEEMIRISCDYDLGNGLCMTLCNYSKDGGVSIHKSGDEGSVFMSEQDARNLRDALNKFLD